MKKRLLGHGIAAIGLAIFVSCQSMGTTPAPARSPSIIPGSVTISHQAAFGGQLVIPIKDYQPVGLVFAESEYWLSMDGTGTITGEHFVYQQLLREAQRAGGHAIVNIVVDVRSENITIGGSVRRQHKWYASALAIRYTTTINAEEVYLTTGPTFSLNDVTSASVGTIDINNLGTFAQHTVLPLKNFEGVGLVFSDVQYEVNDATNTITGDNFTYYQLLREAHRLGAHGIINVTRERRVVTSGNNRQEVWHTSALAIRYTTTLRRTEPLHPASAR